MPVDRLEQPYEDTDILASLTPLTRDWFTARFETFSPPQRYSILNIKKRKNTLVSSPTGSGKTLSAFCAILDDLIHLSQDDMLEDRVYCVYISPLKALGNDIEKNLRRPLAELNERAGRDLGIRIGVRTGDTTKYERQKMRERPPHILITTPESLGIMLTSPKFSKTLHGIDWVVVDEVHALADNKRGTQLSLGLERLQKQTDFTRIGLSATVAPLERVGQYLVGTDRDCDVVDVTYEKKLDIKVLSPVNNLIAASHTHMLDKQYALLDELVQEHKTTIIFTNTRAATERVVHQLRTRFPSHYSDRIAAIDDESDEQGEVRTTIAAHHGSLSKDHRLLVEERLREGSLRCVVSSTSLELGIDIGYVDLVILLGSPKSVARALQRIGRSGHKLHETAKGRIVVLDRDDLVECSVLARQALQRHIDTIHIPEGCLDVLAQEIYGIAINQRIGIRELHDMVQNAYPYRNLSRKDLLSVIKYLSGGYGQLEDRHVYAKIWYDEDEQMIGRRGRMARVLYSTNIGTIPDQTDVIVKIGQNPIGSISEPFLESLKKGDVFVLGGEAYQFRYSRGMTAQVVPAEGRRPTVPSWFSEMLPLSLDLAMHVQRFRGHVQGLLERNVPKEEIIEWILSYLPVDERAARSIHAYHKQQHLFAGIPTDTRILIEYFSDHRSKYVIFHTLYGRRVNDVLSRAVAFALGKLGSGDAQIGINDNGFFLRYKHAVQAKRAFGLLRSDQLPELMDRAVDSSQVLRRRFRHCAGRSLMILRRYKGREKSVGRQQVSSKLLMSMIKRIGEEFPIYREAKREVLYDKMDLSGALGVLEGIEDGSITVEEVSTELPSPFAFSLVLQGYADVMRMEERQEFLRKLHQEVMAKVSLGAKREDMLEIVQPEDFSYDEHWEEEQRKEEREQEDVRVRYKQAVFALARSESLEASRVYDLQRVIDGETARFSEDFVAWLTGILEEAPAGWDDDLIGFLGSRIGELGWR